MEDQEVILVTGVAGYWGRKVAARLIELDGNRHVIGLDVEAPDPEVKDLDFI